MLRQIIIHVFREIWVLSDISYDCVFFVVNLNNQIYHKIYGIVAKLNVLPLVWHHFWNCPSFVHICPIQCGAVIAQVIFLPNPHNRHPIAQPSRQDMGCLLIFMMTSSNENIFRVTGPLCGEFTGHRWIPLTKASDVELWFVLRSAPWINGRVNNVRLVIWDAIALIMTSL